MKSLFKHGDNLYLILRSINESQFQNKTGDVNLELLQSYMKFSGGDHVLRYNNKYLIVETIKEIENENCD
jgi:hypothetical protein